jgi:hypothetical protein
VRSLRPDEALQLTSTTCSNRPVIRFGIELGRFDGASEALWLAAERRSVRRSIQSCATKTSRRCFPSPKSPAYSSVSRLSSRSLEAMDRIDVHAHLLARGLAGRRVIRAVDRHRTASGRVPSLIDSESSDRLWQQLLVAAGQPETQYGMALPRSGMRKSCTRTRVAGRAAATADPGS